MKQYAVTAPGSAASTITGCWNIIGVRGDGSCPELERHVHCRNCPVYSEAAVELLNSAPPDGYVSDWTSHFARPQQGDDRDTRSAFVFRIGTEWLALPTRVVKEVANLRPIHSLPHRGSELIGLVNVRGELLVCVSLVKVLGLEAADAHPSARGSIHQRLLVIRREDVRVVCLVDEVHGLHPFHPRELTEAPATVARAAATCSKHVLSWDGHSVGLLDDDLLFKTLKRSLA